MCWCHYLTNEKKIVRTVYDILTGHCRINPKNNNISKNLLQFCMYRFITDQISHVKYRRAFGNQPHQ